MCSIPSKTCTRVCLAALLALPLVGAGQEDVASLAEAVAAGKAGLGFRYRYEFVDDDRIGDNANASTLRVRLNYETAPYRDWSGLVEFDYVLEALLKDFNSGAGSSGPNRNRYPVVADPNGPDLNQLYLQYAPGDALRVRAGRQRILLDDQRFVGGVGWRQNEQTYDALSVEYLGWERTTLHYSYVANVSRIFGSAVPAGSHEHNTHLLNLGVDLDKNFKVTGYAYLIDNDDAPAFSTRTFGLRAEGGVEIGDARLSLLAEVATQSDAANNPASFDAAYFRLQALWTRQALTIGAGYEVLGEDNGQGFRTPLATLHAFNGWADQFLATPAGGIEDLYLRAGTTVRKWSLSAAFHDFTAESSGERYGREIDLSAGRTLGNRHAVLLKAAIFDSDSSGFGDVTKLWLMLSTTF